MRRFDPASPWTIVGASALIVCLGIGAMFSLGVFLTSIEASTGWSRSAISTVALVNWLAMGLGSLLWGALSDRFGTRVVAVAGGALLGLGLALSSQAQRLWQLDVAFGFLVGFSVGAFYAPLTSTATKWFTTNRGLAVALVSSGIGLGILLVAPLTRWLITLYGWRTAMLLLGDLCWLVIIPVALLVREAPPGVAAGATGAGARHASLSARDVFTSPQFWTIALTHFACCAAHSGPIFHMVAHVTETGIPGMTAATVFGVSGLSSIGGRVGGGLLADRFGAKRALVAGLSLQASMIFLYLFAHGLGVFFAIALVFGIAYGGVMPLYALVTREQFGERLMGTAYGAVFLVSTVGMGAGSFAGGVIHDHLGTYAWLYGASAAVGLLAAAIALTFRPRVLIAPVPALG